MYSHASPGIVRRAILTSAASLAAGAVTTAAIPAQSSPSLLSDDAKALMGLRRRIEAVSAQLMADWTDEQADALYDPLDEQWGVIRERVLARPVRSWSDVVERALLSLDVIGRRTDGVWFDFEDVGDGSSLAECNLAVLIMAGITDGQIERHGDGSWQPPPEIDVGPVPKSFDGRAITTARELVSEFGGVEGFCCAVACDPEQVKRFIAANKLHRSWFWRVEADLILRGKRIDPDLLWL